MELNGSFFGQNANYNDRTELGSNAIDSSHCGESVITYCIPNKKTMGPMPDFSMFLVQNGRPRGFHNFYLKNKVDNLPQSVSMISRASGWVQQRRAWCRWKAESQGFSSAPGSPLDSLCSSRYRRNTLGSASRLSTLFSCKTASAAKCAFFINRNWGIWKVDAIKYGSHDPGRIDPTDHGTVTAWLEKRGIIPMHFGFRHLDRFGYIPRDLGRIRRRTWCRWKAIIRGSLTQLNSSLDSS